MLQSEAEADLAEAYQWYERQRVGLGREFIESVETVFARIQKLRNCTQRPFSMCVRLSCDGSRTSFLRV